MTKRISSGQYISGRVIFLIISMRNILIIPSILPFSLSFLSSFPFPSMRAVSESQPSWVQHCALAHVPLVQAC